MKTKGLVAIVAIFFFLTFTAFGQTSPPRPVVRPKRIVLPKPDPMIEGLQTKYAVSLIGEINLSKPDLKLAAGINNFTAIAVVNADKDATTTIKFEFERPDELTEDSTIVVWIMSEEGDYAKIGAVPIDSESKNSMIEYETELKDFGLFMTSETEVSDQPAGKVYDAFEVVD